jgi:hypothetical protein
MCLRYSISCTRSCDQDKQLSQYECKLIEFRSHRFREGGLTAFVKETTRNKQNRQCSVT